MSKKKDVIVLETNKFHLEVRAASHSVVDGKGRPVPVKT